jgi:5-methylcytosine-specific restriction protein A
MGLTIQTMNRKCGSHDKRTTGTTWQNIRKRVLSNNPLCVHCQLEGRTTLAEEVDHIKPLHQGGTDDYSNLQGLCVEHHLIKTATEQGYTYKPKVTVGLDGWPI